MKHIDAKGHARHLSARLRKHQLVQKGPADPTEPSSVAAHGQKLRDADTDIVEAILRINDDDPDSEQD
ncbi:hypothetical protein [Burkholderia vietnamiensis]|uniref:hypothetical protein n=1 Tax=Burkholderia vietnamiensis TaxID=60552 RepID=UPI001CF3CD88|nr:hypothetical protein [Burkholderia vietnamiensis]MCA8292115.1 hypothetical protein [Burkholderia vietnamiensis]